VSTKQVKSNNLQFQQVNENHFSMSVKQPIAQILNRAPIMKKKKNDNFSLTHEILFKQFGNVLIPVEELAESYLNLARRTALNMAKTHSLPFPCFRLGNSNKSPMVVHLSDFSDYIDNKNAEERRVWTAFQIG